MIGGCDTSIREAGREVLRTFLTMRKNKVGEVDTSLPTIEAGLVGEISSLTMEA